MNMPYTPSEDTYLLEDTLGRVGKVGGIAVEVGCGTGYILERIAKLAEEVVGVDIQQEALREARRRTGNIPTIHLIQADMLSCLRPSSRIKLVVANPPYLPSDDEFHDETIHGGPTGIEALIRIIREAGIIMAKDINVIAITSSHADLNKLERYARENNLEVKTMMETRLFFEKLLSLNITYKQAEKW